MSQLFNEKSYITNYTLWINWMSGGHLPFCQIQWSCLVIRLCSLSWSVGEPLWSSSIEHIIRTTALTITLVKGPFKMWRMSMLLEEWHLQYLGRWPHQPVRIALMRVDLSRPWVAAFLYTMHAHSHQFLRAHNILEHVSSLLSPIND